MAYLGFDRGESEFPAAFYMGSEDVLKRFHFRGVSDFGGRAVGFNKIHFPGTVIHLRECVFYGHFLALRIGGRDALPLSIRRRSNGIYQRVDLVSVPYSVRISLQYVHRNGFGHDEPVCPLVERPRSVSRKRAYLAKLDESGRGHHLVRAAGYRHVEFT